MQTREKNLNSEKEKAEKALNTKYEQLALQFSAYGSLINQMEASFSGLKIFPDNPPEDVISTQVPSVGIESSNIVNKSIGSSSIQIA